MNICSLLKINMKHWNLGNTTVRNPDRIKEALIVFKKNFEGKVFNENEQLKFFNKLLQGGIIKSKKSSSNSGEISGRKWAACFNQLGLAKAWKSKGKVEITNSGNALVDEDVIGEDIFLRQFLKYKLPSDIEKGKGYEGFDVNPFYVILRLLNELDDEGFKGLTKEEISLYVITCIRNDSIETVKKNILDYRAERSSMVGKVRKKKYYHERKKEIISKLYNKEISERKDIIIQLSSEIKLNNNFINSSDANEMISKVISGGKGANTRKSQDLKRLLIQSLMDNNLEKINDSLVEMYVETKGGTLGDYADTTVRYTIKTGLLSISGDKLIIKEDRKLFISKLLSEFKDELEGITLEDFYSSQKPHIPSDNIEFLKANISNLEKKRLELESKIKTNLPKISKVKVENNPNKLRKLQKDIEDRIKDIREILFYKNQSSKDMIEDILEYYDKIQDRSLFGGDAYRPAYLEWTTWRLFLAINNIFNEISQTRNFNIDEELNPIHHARGGVPDMVFEYEDFIIVCEVTLLTSSNQWAEDEPVQRHVANVIKNTDKKVYGVFIAPNIDPNTIYEYHRKKRLIDGKEFNLNIISFTIDQIKELLKKFDISRFKTNELGELLGELSGLQYKTDSPLEWQKMVNKKYNQWIS